MPTIDILKECAGTDKVLTVIYQKGRASGYKRNITVLSVSPEDGTARIIEIDKENNFLPKIYELALISVVDENYPAPWMPIDAGITTSVSPETYFSKWAFQINPSFYAALGVVYREVIDKEKTLTARRKAIALGMDRKEATRRIRILRGEYVVYSPIIYDFQEGDIFYTNRNLHVWRDWIQVIKVTDSKIEPMLYVNFKINNFHSFYQCSASQLAQWLQSGENKDIYTSKLYTKGKTMKINRELQRTILEKLKDIYPKNFFDDLSTLDKSSSEDAIFENLFYLAEHGLVEMETDMEIDSGNIFKSSAPRITVKGIDFIEDDGGLSAILNTITIKIHSDTIRELLIDKIKGENISDNDKSKFIEYIKTIPETAMNSAIGQFVSMGIKSIPDINTLMTLLNF